MPKDNQVPVEQWLLVWEQMDYASRTSDDHASMTHLLAAVDQLLRILEPPSVREARLGEDAVSAMSEEDE